jgi:hypothetical protein
MDRLDFSAASPAAAGSAPLGTTHLRPRGRRIRLSLLLCATLALSGVASGDPAQVHASVVQALSLSQLTYKADEVLVAVATGTQARRHVDGKLIVTDVRLSVAEVLKGELRPGGTAVATVLGGTLDGVALQVPGEASFALGERALVFLYRAPRSGDLRVVGMSQGVLPVRDDAGRTMVLPGGSGAALVEQKPAGGLDDAQPAISEAQPLTDVVARIRAIVTQQRQQQPAK